ncbi:MAG: sigma-54-dependent Fis family transcriptional regulator [Firmicutes bacterium]|nr:sigma-54-dependent Fis family transcriptional regulator [Bacillota bacterium]
MINNEDFNILIVDDEREYLDVLEMILNEKGYNISSANSALEALNKLKKEKFHLVLTDLIMDKMDGIELLEKINKKYHDLEVILVTGYGSVKNAVEAMKKGAYGYFIKGHDPEELLLEIKKVQRLTKLKSDNILLKKNEVNRNSLLKTKNKKFSEVINVAEKVANTDVNVLIMGESGVGKEILSRYIHECSYRNNERFVAVNCQSFSENLLESELFGHEKGAFTGAVDKRVGRFEQAHKGTLFLDEIGEMPLSVQTKLLRVIENKNIQRIGSNKTINLDLRFISATNRDIPDEVKKGNFREDLFYRMNTIILDIPPLRERKEDLKMFVNFFLDKKSKEMKKKVFDIEKEVLDFLLNYDYPGNIRELKNIVERLVVLSEGGVIRANDLPGYQNKKEKLYYNKSLKEIRKEAEIKYIKNVLQKYNGNITKAAKNIDISRRQLFNKIVEYDLK